MLHLIPIGNIQISASSIVFCPSACPSWVAKSLTLDIPHTVLTKFFLTRHAFGFVDFYHFVPLSVS